MEECEHEQTNLQEIVFPSTYGDMLVVNNRCKLCNKQFTTIWKFVGGTKEWLD